MKRFVHALLVTTICLLLTACGGDDGPAPEDKPTRTVIVYFNAENNLSENAEEDINEIVEGSKKLAATCNLILYIDDMELPRIYAVKNGEISTVFRYSAELDSSSPKTILSVFSKIMALYPAEEYASVFWGHGDGSMISYEISTPSKIDQLSSDVESNTNEVERQSFGVDFNTNNDKSHDFATWINIPELARVLNRLPKQEYIFFDACLMQSVENAYELRNCTDYIIATCSETPEFGGNYKELVPIFGMKSAETVAKTLVNRYIDGNTWGTPKDQSDGVCISAVKTSEMESLLNATHDALTKILGKSAEVSTSSHSQTIPSITSCIYYYKTGGSSYGRPIFFDINDVMLNNLTTEEHSQWKQAFDKVVIEKRHPRDFRKLEGITTKQGKQICCWIPSLLTERNFKSFLLNDKTFGGLSIFIPKEEYSNYTKPNMNKCMFDYEWCQKVGWER